VTISIAALLVVLTVSYRQIIARSPTLRRIGGMGIAAVTGPTTPTMVQP
jgi:hypothetical protein